LADADCNGSIANDRRPLDFRRDLFEQLQPFSVHERMGHASIQMTLDVYGHLFPRGDDSGELAKAEKAFF
jgi:integrase